MTSSYSIRHCAASLAACGVLGMATLAACGGSSDSADDAAATKDTPTSSSTEEATSSTKSTSSSTSTSSSGSSSSSGPTPSTSSDASSSTGSSMSTSSGSSGYPEADGLLESLRHPEWIYGGVVSVEGDTLVIDEYYEYGLYGEDDPRTEISRAYAEKNDPEGWPPPNEILTVDLDKRRTFSLANTDCILIAPDAESVGAGSKRPCSALDTVINGPEGKYPMARAMYTQVRVSRDGGSNPQRLEGVFYP